MSAGMNEAPSRGVLLVWCGVLHAFTHSFHVALLPLYLLIQRDLELPGVGHSTLLMTVMMMAYFLPSYHLGVWADRYERRRLLGVGLVLNGLGFVLLAWAPSYAWAVLACVVTGFGGSFYHPAATALIAELYSDQPGRAFGLVGIGANVGLLGVPIYSGWRVSGLLESSGDAAWRVPVFELGAAAVLGGLLFLWMTRGTRLVGKGSEGSKGPVSFGGARVWGLLVVAALAFSLRDFAGMSMGSLGALFLQQAHGFSTTQTGVAVSAIFLAAVISNPVFGQLSDRHRTGWVLGVMTLAGLTVVGYPLLPRAGLIPGLVVYGFFFMACYPMIEAALMESIPESMRGRIFGAFLVFSGVVGNLSHGWVGGWVEGLGARASEAVAYRGVYGLLGGLIWVSMCGLMCLRQLRRIGIQEGTVRISE